MRIPTRRSQQQRQALEVDEPLYLTQKAVENMKRTLKDLQERQLPQAIEDTRTTGEHGDFSENAEYQEAKSRMRRCHNRITSIKEKLKRVILIEKGEGDTIVLGSHIVVVKEGVQTAYHIVGPHEANPFKKRISYKSPLGATLMGRSVGETVEVQGVEYQVVEIN